MTRVIGFLLSGALTAGHFGLVPTAVGEKQAGVAASVHRWQAQQSAGIACAIRIQRGAETCTAP
jgi:hypothetical protein